MTHNNTTESTLHAPHYLPFQPVKYHYACHRKQKKTVKNPRNGKQKKRKTFCAESFS